jgi:hypothetical protein
VRLYTMNAADWTERLAGIDADSAFDRAAKGRKGLFAADPALTGGGSAGYNATRLRAYLLLNPQALLSPSATYQSPTRALPRTSGVPRTAATVSPGLMRGSNAEPSSFM